ncbi:MAG: peptidase [Betaproteobacteria bacterium]|nr:peptidase [Betaproteobacteria bacterium]
MRVNSLSRSIIAAAVIATTGYVYVEAGLPGMTRAQAIVPTASAAPLMVPGAQAMDFSSIVKAYGPAVVNITVTGVRDGSDGDNGAAQRRGGPQTSPDDPLFEFFKRFGIPQQQTPKGPQLSRGLGSGFIVSADGVIITNAHVVDGAQEVDVKLTDKREFRAKVIGVDKRSDVAVIKIDAKNLPVVRIGNPAEAQVGEWVLAIGSPFGFENTATAGIVSAKSRNLPGDAYVPFIQTDVAVNPGNSGGPLFNARGEVIGINSQIYSGSGGYQGLSFAIPMDVVAKVQSQLLAHGKVVRGRIGVSVQDVNQALADSFGLKGMSGALVSSIEPGSPADKAGLLPGDVITAVNGGAVEGSGDLSARIADISPGSRARIDLVRKGAPKTIEAKIGELQDTKVAKADTEKADQGRLGLAVRPLDRDEKKQVGAEGLVVEQVAGPSERAGIQPGDIILSLNGNKVTTVDELRSLVNKAGKRVALLVQREDAKIFVPVDLG